MKRILLTSVLLTIGMLVMAAMVTAGVPCLINYQGRLTNSLGNPLDTTVSITFNIYSDSVGGAAIWSETHPAVNVVKGLFTVKLGSLSPGNWDENLFIHSYPPGRFLGIKVGGNAEMTSRSMFTTSPFAVYASCVDGFNPGSQNVDSGMFTVVAGDSNIVRGDYSSITGGNHNEIDPINADDTTEGDLMDYTGYRMPTPGFGAFVGGGFFNHAHGNFSVIGGGVGNTSYCGSSAVVGGWGNYAGSKRSFIGGGFKNTIGDQNCLGKASVITGGGRNNIGYNFYATIGGGFSNQILAEKGTISGGDSNYIASQSIWGTVAGGHRNQITDSGGAILGGEQNTTSGSFAGIGGGKINQAGGHCAAIPGGYDNRANGRFSLAAGQSAQALHLGSFVWNDNSAGVFASTNNNQFLIHATGGVGIGTSNPIAQLHINGTTRFSGVATIVSGQYLRSEDNGGARILGAQGNTAVTPAIGFFSTNGVDDGGGGNGIFRPSANAMAFAVQSTEKMRITGYGIGIGTTTPTGSLDVNGINGYNQIRMRTSYTPSGTGDTNGNVGDIAWDNNFIYIKTSAGWKRTPLAIF